MDGSACGESEKMLAAVDDAARRNFNNYLSRSLLCCLRLLLPHMMTARTDSNVYINFRICIDSSLSANMGWVAVAYCRDYTRHGIKLRMTQVTLADRAGVGLRFVRDLEQGKTTLRLDKVNQVLQMFGGAVSVGEMDRSIYA